MTTTRLSSAWRTRLTHILAITLLGIALVGCTPEVESWTPSETPTPTPTWKPEEQAAIDAVERYINTYVDLTHKLPVLTEEDWDQIYATTVDPRRTEMLDSFLYFSKKGFTVTGEPVFSLGSVEFSETVTGGTLIAVSGCYVQEDFHFFNAAGEEDPLAWLRSYRTYTVFVTQGGQHYVRDIHNEEDAC